MDLADSDIEAKVPNSEHAFHTSWKKMRYIAGWCEMLVNSDKRYLLACVTLEQKQHLELLLGSRLGIFSSCSKSLVRGRVPSAQRLSNATLCSSSSAALD